MIEQRRGKRFHVDWPVRVEGVGESGATFTETGTLENISSGGALLLLHKLLKPGDRLEVVITLPLKSGKTMKFSACVVRVQMQAVSFGAALKFGAPKPDFAAIRASG